MPNYKITFFLLNGKKKTGIRFHVSQDISLIKSVAVANFKKATPEERLDYIDVEPTALGKNMNV